MDLASAHMANNTLDFLQQQIKFISEGANLPFIASLRPIKDFWAALKKAFFNKSCEATSFPSFKGKIRQKAHKVSLPMVLRLFNTIKEGLTICERNEH